MKTETLPMENMHTTGTSARQTWIDIYKGIAIALVVLGHLAIPKKLYIWIYLFHMYAFFFIAGVTYHYRETRNWLDYFRSSVKRLYVPYLCYGAIWNLILVIRAVHSGAVALSGRYLVADALSLLLGGKLFYWVESAGPVWFLCALLFFGSRIFYSLVNQGKKLFCAEAISDRPVVVRFFLFFWRLFHKPIYVRDT